MLNSATLQGRLAAVPEIKKTQSGTSVCSFTLAVTRDYAKQGEERKTDWIDFIAWGKTAEHIGKYFTKGQEMLVSGRIETRTYEDKNSSKRKAIEVIAESVHFCGKKESEQQSYTPASADVEYTAEDDDGDLPF